MNVKGCITIRSHQVFSLTNTNDAKIPNWIISKGVDTRNSTYVSRHGSRHNSSIALEVLASKYSELVPTFSNSSVTSSFMKLLGVSRPGSRLLGSVSRSHLDHIKQPEELMPWESCSTCPTLLQTLA